MPTVTATFSDYAWCGTTTPGTLLLRNQANAVGVVGIYQAGTNRLRLGVIFSLTMPALASGYIRRTDLLSSDAGADISMGFNNPYSGGTTITNVKMRLGDIVSAPNWATTTNTPSSPATGDLSFGTSITIPTGNAVGVTQGFYPWLNYIAKYGWWAGSTRNIQVIFEDNYGLYNHACQMIINNVGLYVYYTDTPILQIASAVGLNRGINAGFNRGGQL